MVIDRNSRVRRSDSLVQDSARPRKGLPEPYGRSPGGPELVDRKDLVGLDDLPTGYR